MSFAAPTGVVELHTRKRRPQLRNRSLHVDVPRRVHRGAQSGSGQRARGQRAPPPRVVLDRCRRWPRGSRPPTRVNGEVFDEKMSTGAVVAGRGTFEPAADVAV